MACDMPVNANHIPRLVAHRGLHDRWPENSLAAMTAAWNDGIDWCECDIHLSADGQAVVIHDSTLDRTTTGKGDVAKHTWDELRRFRLRGKSRMPTDQPIPGLEELLVAMPPNGGLLIEIKAKMRWHEVQGILGLIRGHRCMLQAFDAQIMDLVCRCDTAIPTGWLVDDVGKAVPYGATVDLPYAAVNADYRSLNGLVVRQLHEAGRFVGAWTVNEEVDISSMLAMGVDTIITDRPATVARLMRAAR